jgi:hypothetical protein
MGIPLGLVLLPLLLLNVADAPHEEAPAANQDLPTGFHLPIRSCPGEHNRLLTTLLSPDPDPELAVPSSSPSSLLGLHMVHPSRYPSIIVRIAMRRTGREAMAHHTTTVTRLPCRSRRKAKGWRRCWARELKAENYFFQFDEGAALDHRFRKFPRL